MVARDWRKAGRWLAETVFIALIALFFAVMFVQAVAAIAAGVGIFPIQSRPLASPVSLTVVAAISLVIYRYITKRPDGH